MGLPVVREVARHGVAHGAEAKEANLVRILAVRRARAGEWVRVVAVGFQASRGRVQGCVNHR